MKENPHLSSHSTYLNDLWTLYFHDPNNPDWTFKSYINIATFSTVNEYFSIDKALKDKLAHGMFFLMREHVFPCYDDALNQNGGVFTLKVATEDTARFWNELSIRTVGETLAKNMSVINGLSVSPKRCFCIVKIWVANTETTLDMLDMPKGYVGEILFKRHRG